MKEIHPPTGFVSCALPYVNAAPHLGFALELVIADVIARAQRLRGDDVCFVSGTDEHSLKNVLTAERLGIATHELVAANAQRFRALIDALDISVDEFVRTSSHPLHHGNVQAVWQRLEQGGDLYLKDYCGLYCRGCERFYELAELTNGECPEHVGPLEPSSERNWFFRLSRYREQLIRVIETDAVGIEPESAKREVLQFLRGDVLDLSISRDATRARGFGIPVPSDATQVVYVWVDALFGYLTALGDERERYWSSAQQRVHVIGKGITRFHAVYWLALLLAIGEPLPTRILVHGYLTVDGQKISKSGRTVDPHPLIQEYGSDALRYYLLRHVKTTRDGDFSDARLLAANDSELANQLGNLVSRTLALVERFAAARVPNRGETTRGDDVLLEQAGQLDSAVRTSIDAFQLDRGLDLIFNLVEGANRYVDEQAPWALFKQGQQSRVATVLHTLCCVLLALARALSPYLPTTSKAIFASLGASEADLVLRENTIARPSPLFPRRAPTKQT